MSNQLAISYVFLSLILTGSSWLSARVESFQDEQESAELRAKMTFIELGSVRCIPCRAMQPIMRAVAKKYGEQIKIIFYDVWRPDQRHYGTEYGIRLIPTQVFLDSTGTEIFRHEGFFPEKEIVEFLDAQGLKPIIAD